MLLQYYASPVEPVAVDAVRTTSGWMLNPSPSGSRNNTRFHGRHDGDDDDDDDERSRSRKSLEMINGVRGRVVVLGMGLLYFPELFAYWKQVFFFKINTFS